VPCAQEICQPLHLHDVGDFVDDHMGCNGLEITPLNSVKKIPAVGPQPWVRRLLVDEDVGVNEDWVTDRVVL
jgi:hypothetical protein